MAKRDDVYDDLKEVLDKHGLGDSLLFFMDQFDIYMEWD